MGKILPEGKGVTYDLFTTQAGGGEEQADENDEVDVDAKKENWNYVSDVVMEAKMHYFQIPKLGSYLAVPLFINSYLNENSFDNAYEKTLEYKKASQKLEEDKKIMEEEFQGKIEEAKANGDALDEVQAEFDEKLKEFEPIDEPTFESLPKKYVLCCDTLGKDCEIAYDDRVYINSLTQHFARSWENRELNYIKNDVEQYITYINSAGIEETLARFGEHEERELMTRAKEIEDLGEKYAQYKTDEIKLECVREHLQEEAIRKQILDLKDYRLIKFPKVTQNALILTDHKLEDFNTPNTHLLNWKMVRNKYINDEFLDKILAYEYKGPKDAEVPTYAYVNRLKQRLGG